MIQYYLELAMEKDPVWLLTMGGLSFIFAAIGGIILIAEREKEQLTSASPNKGIIRFALLLFISGVGGILLGWFAWVLLVGGAAMGLMRLFKIAVGDAIYWLKRLG